MKPTVRWIKQTILLVRQTKQYIQYEQEKCLSLAHNKRENFLYYNSSVNE